MRVPAESTCPLVTPPSQSFETSTLLRGGIGRAGDLQLISHAKDFTLMTPFGGPPTLGFTWLDEHRAEFARFFKCGGGDVELVWSCASSSLVVRVLDRTAAGGDRSPWVGI